MKKYLKPLYIKKKKSWLLLTATALLGFAAFTAFKDPINRFDNTIFNLITPHITDSRTRLMKFITFYGNHGFLIPANILLVLFFIVRKDKWMAITIGVVALSSLGLMSLLKNTTQRHRPSDPLVPGITNFSFPSGHAFMSVAFYGLLIWLAIYYVSVKWKRYAINAFLMLVILVIGFTRVYLRVHYASDVIAGYCAGILWLLFCLFMMQQIQLYYKKKEDIRQGL